MRAAHILPVATLLLSVAPAVAASGVATGTVNMRTGPSTGYEVIAVIPEGAPVDIFECAAWCEVEFAGYQGYVSANYLATVTGSIAPSTVVVRPEPRYRVYEDDYADYDYPSYSYPRYSYPRSPGYSYYGYDNDYYDYPRRRYSRDRDYGRYDRSDRLDGLSSRQRDQIRALRRALD